MHPKFRRAHVAAVAATLLLSAVAAAADESYPSRPIRLVSGFSAGGGADVLGRILARRMSEILQQPVVMENVPGAGGMVGAARVAQAAPDGYQVLLGSRADAINMTLFKKPLYDFAADLMPVILIAVQPTVLLARPNFPASSLQDLIAYGKSHNDVKFASAGVGSSGHLDCVQFNNAVGIKGVHVPYRGGGAAIQDVIAGHVDYICTLVPTAAPLIASKQVKAVAVFTAERVPNVPEVPTALEQGVGDTQATTWFALFVPKGTPASLIHKLRAATSEALDTPSVQEQLGKAGAAVTPVDQRSSKFLKEFVDAEIASNALLIKASGVSID